ncbi:uncharacterized protein SCHCODRAFT_02680797 [Schizophyllum commune H4-8]|uniref:Uncharacterized protein n=1 Tax=Schizophyllum commune (strain H4-8 / FGSC 9210) TaxID=578458 RepID=D8QFZ1_SCHCM|nr:uncharacterized protein SCHCODRAFT_02680797 [Schizophyllum commune H4-8]KAI5887844.1 hypothetical protein SCHCODRAFT_02680797 [Schizophyllum commune H4-8]
MSAAFMNLYHASSSRSPATPIEFGRGRTQKSALTGGWPSQQASSSQFTTQPTPRKRRHQRSYQYTEPTLFVSGPPAYTPAVPRPTAVAMTHSTATSLRRLRAMPRLEVLEEADEDVVEDEDEEPDFVPRTFRSRRWSSVSSIASSLASIPEKDERDAA